MYPIRHLVALFTLACAAPSARAVEKTDVFVSGRDGYHTYRIPAMLRLENGALLAFCEGRKNSNVDIGDIDLLVKRSTDEGRTWSAAQVIWSDGPNTCGNPCPVVDRATGTIWLLATHNLEHDHLADIVPKRSPGTRTPWVMRSTDHGATWSQPKEITRAAKDPKWGWYATGPGIGIQIKSGPHAGRLVIPATHSYDDPAGRIAQGPYEFGAHVIYSDDGGSTWKLGGTIRPKVNECQVVELFDGRGTLLMDMRSGFGRGCRAQATSTDGGLTWSAPQDAPVLVEPVCQASILRYEPASGQPGLILFSNPADGRRKQRVRLTVRASEDNARTWPRALVLHPGPASYSCLVGLAGGVAGCLYENGENDRYDRITLARFRLDEIAPLR
jgi:sialidase-1